MRGRGRYSGGVSTDPARPGSVDSVAPTASQDDDSWDVGAVPTRAEPAGPRRLADGATVALRPGLEVTVRALLGRGGMGEVYLVHDPRLQREAALKLVRTRASVEASIHRFRREAVVTARLDHPGIPPVHEAGRTPSGHAYLLMRYLPGEALSAHLRRLHAGGGRPSLEALRPLLAGLPRVCDAVAYAHSRGVVHRDLKPANVVLGAFGEVCVVDWGLARDGREPAGVDRPRAEAAAGPPPAPDAGLTQDGAILGTIGFVAPEVVRGAEAGPAADVFALGALLSCLLTGRPPFAKGPPVKVLARAGEGRLEWPRARRPDLPAELHAIAERALAPDPTARYPSAAALGADLEAFLAGREVAAHRYRLPERAARAVRRRPGAFAAATSGLVALLLGLAGAAWLRAESVRGARAELAAEARRSAEAAAAEARRWEPGLAGDPDGARRRLALALRELSAAQRWHALAPGARAARERRFAAALALGDAARALEQWALAGEAFAEAERLGVDDDRARAERVAVERAAGAAERRRRETLERVLERAASGALERPGALDDALFALARYPDAETVERLAGALDAVSGELRTAELGVWREVAAGGGPPGLVEAAAARQRLRGEAELPPEAARALRTGEERLAAGAPAGRPRRPAASARLVLAQRQRERVALADRRVADLACAALGRLGRREVAVAALDGYLHAVWDVERAIPAALALCRVGGAEALRAVRGAYARHARDPVLTEAVDPALRAMDVGDLGPVADDAGARIARAGLFLDLGRPEAALGELDRAARSRPDDPDLLRYRAGARQTLGDARGALADLDALVTVRPDARAYRARGDLLRVLGRLGDAEADYGRAIDLAPGWAAPRLNRGVVRQGRGDLEAALEDYARVRELAPRIALAWANAGGAHLELGRPAAAEPLLTRALELEPQRAEVWRSRARARRGQGDVSGALADLREALRRDPTLAAAWSDMGLLRLERGDPEGALADYERALELAGGDPGFEATARFNRGQALAALGRLDEARAELARAAALDPGNPTPCVARAVVHVRLGDAAAARGDLDEALRRDPDHAEALHNRAALAKRAGDVAAAAADLERLVARRPAFARAQFELAAARLTLGDVAGALAALEAVVARDPQDLDARILRGLALVAAGRRAAALRSLAGAAGRRDDAAVFLAACGGESPRLDEVAGAGSWEGALARFLRGDLDLPGLLADAAERDPPAERPRYRQSAHLHAGLRAEAAGDAAAAAAGYRAAVEAAAPTPTAEAALARLLLERLGG